MRILVTGAAGFIGSHLCERLLQIKDHHVIGVDTLMNNSKIKQRNLGTLLKNPRFHFHNVHLLNTNLSPLLKDIDVVYHMAGMPGVRSSWGSDFDQYVASNILVTQKLLEACRERPLKKFIYISTSSVYGEKKGKVSENALPEPLSPNGVSKLSGENLCRVYQENEGIPIVILRYFSVYGPRQYPDMAFHRLIHHILQRKPIQIYGDGKQTRDFTYVGDCVEGTLSVLYTNKVIGETINIGGTERASILEVMNMIKKILNAKIQINFIEQPKGEPKHTWADLSKARSLLNYQPIISLKSGLEKEINDLKLFYKEG